jgi:Coenzyme PQQ synthesis protein D (PqqD)
LEESGNKIGTERFSINPDAVANRMGDQVVVVHVGTDRIFELNTTAARIWDLLSEGRGRTEIRRLVSQEFNVPETLAAAQIEELLDSLISENIITAQVHEQSD